MNSSELVKVFRSNEHTLRVSILPLLLYVVQLIGFYLPVLPLLAPQVTLLLQLPFHVIFRHLVASCGIRQYNPKQIFYLLKI